ncbi:MULTISPECIES: hypothetical protein [Pseudomonas]|uniref:hypothetical protein n=1 Tax=Pseudomonas TaxID=286 RepID=UPI000C880597|nr:MULTISPECIES: hypothetical protein [Pseudomonas]PMY33893.1 hypothetical protein C1Y36_30415 [Pseudomonas sp. FW306-2-2C-D06C]PYC29767.1 hypothetical protein DMW99_30655 [Pseudomonas chlororaphis]
MSFFEFLHEFFSISCIAVILGMFVWICVCLRFAYTSVDEYLELLKNCSAVVSLAPLRQGGPWGRLLLMGGITSIVTFPGVYLKHGGVSVDDLEGFPKPLKKKFFVLQWTLRGLLAIMLVSVIGVKAIEYMF